MASRQNKIKLLLPQLSKGHQAHKILSKLPPKYLTPKLLLSLQQKSLQVSFQPPKKEFQPKSYCNKYFGQKALCVEDSHDLHRAIHSCKLLERVKFDKNILSKEGFKTVGDLILIGKEIPIQMSQITKIARGCKGKVSIVSNQNKYRYTEIEMFQRSFQNQKNQTLFNYQSWMKKWLKNCNVNLQSLSLTFQSIDQFPIWKNNLRNLRHFSLKFDKKFARRCSWKLYVPPLDYAFKNYRDPYFTFLLQIIKNSPRLQTVRLDLVPYSITPTPLAYLLLILNYYEIPDWYVRTGTVSDDFMKIVNGANIEEINKMAPKGRKSTAEVLKKVDLLAIYVVNYISKIHDIANEFDQEQFEDYGAFKGSVPRLGELPEVTCKYKKILDVTLTDFSLEKCSVNLKNVLSRFSGLEGLYLKLVENVVLYENKDDVFPKKEMRKPRFQEEEIKEEKQHAKIIQDSKKKKITDELGWTRNLKEAWITFLAIRGIGQWDFESKTESFSKLMGVLKAQCGKLSFLNVFRGHPVFHYNHSCVGYRRNPLTVPCDKITGMKNLTKLEVTSDNLGLESIGKTLRTLKNLEKLTINIVNNDHFEMFDPVDVYEGGWERQKDFYEFDEKEKILFNLPKLREMELVIFQSEFSVKWTEHFVKYLPSLKSLEVLKVIDGNKGEIPLEVFIKIVDGLLRRTTLKRVEIDSVIVKNDSALELAAVLMGGGVSKKGAEDLAIKTLKGKIENLVELNLALELVDMKDFKGMMKIKRILYDTRTKIL